MAVDRGTRPGTRILHGVMVLVGLALAGVAMSSTAEAIGNPASALRRYRDSMSAPHVFARGVLRGTRGTGVSPLCRVSYEHWQRCGKNSCWAEIAAMTSTAGTLDVEWSSSPLPPNVQLSSAWRFEPFAPGPVVTDGERADVWVERARRSALAFPPPSSDDRIVERCLDEHTPVFLEGCIDTNPRGEQVIVACSGQRAFGVVEGVSGQAAIDDAANGLAWRLGVAFVGLLLAVLALVPREGLLADALALRAGLGKRGLGAAWALFAVPVVGLFVNVLLHASQAPSTWATGRGGYVLASSVLAGWALLARVILRRRDTLRAALKPVLATPRSPLARASGTAELSVRARARGDGVSPVLGDDRVAFAEARITEVYKAGKNLERIERAVVRPSEELEVVDESGDGVLHLGNAILDVEIRRAKFDDVPPRVVAAGIEVRRHEDHVHYLVDEKIIRHDERLYVFGDVTAIAQRADEAGYRAVRGSPTLGVAPSASGSAAPVIVYSGDERGLVESLGSEARSVELLSIMCFGAAGLLSAALAYVASL